MSREHNASAREDGLLIRALAHGETGALGPLLDRHLPRLYGLLRMTLPSEIAVGPALSDVFCVAAERASEPLARANPERWLLGIALEQLERRAGPEPPVSLAERRRRRQGEQTPVVDSVTARLSDGTTIGVGRDAIAGITDRALTVLVRTLDGRRRQALVLGVVLGLDDADVAGTIGCETWEVEGLKREALAGLAERLVEHERREAELKREIAEIPYKLRPLPTGDAYGEGRGPGGSTVVVGHRVHLEPHAPEQGILNLVRRALRRLGELFRRHRHGIDLDVDSGESSRARSPELTPSLQPFEKPSSTPTTRGHRSPKLSPGVAVYAMPRTTPTTRRLSNRRRPLPPPGR